MSRFKFVCGCGKRLAAYDWMIGQVVTCPKCGTTQTVPTPFQAEEKLEEMMDKGYSVTRRKIGIPVDQSARKKKLVFVLVIVATGILVLAAAVGLFLSYLKSL
jgi:hypothetical protein